MKNNTLELKLYSPITGHLMEDNWDEDDFDVSFYDYEGTPLSPYEMTAFEDVVHKAIEDEKMPEEVERGLMEYYSGHEPASVDQKVLSAFVDAEVYDHQLWGVLKCTLKEPLTPEELEDFLEDKTSYGSTFFVPREARWECEDNGDGWTGLLHVKVDVAAKLKRALVAIEKENIQLDGVLKNIDIA